MKQIIKTTNLFQFGFVHAIYDPMAANLAHSATVLQASKPGLVEHQQIKSALFVALFISF